MKTKQAKVFLSGLLITAEYTLWGLALILIIMAVNGTLGNALLKLVTAVFDWLPHLFDFTFIFTALQKLIMFINFQPIVFV